MEFENLQVILIEQELLTNYKYIIFTNNHSATEDKKYFYIFLRGVDFLFLSNTLGWMCTLNCAQYIQWEKYSMLIQGQYFYVELKFSTLFLRATMVYIGFQVS